MIIVYFDAQIVPRLARRSHLVWLCVFLTCPHHSVITSLLSGTRSDILSLFCNFFAPKRSSGSFQRKMNSVSRNMFALVRFPDCCCDSFSLLLLSSFLPHAVFLPPACRPLPSSPALPPHRPFCLYVDTWKP